MCCNMGRDVAAVLLEAVSAGAASVGLTHIIEAALPATLAYRRVWSVFGAGVALHVGLELSNANGAWCRANF